MNALLLPGNSSRHSAWAEDLKKAVHPHFDAVKAQHYRHWQTGEEWADVDYEIETAKESADTLEPYVIIGKSIGTVIAVKGTAEGLLQPKKLVLLGVPIQGGAKKDIFLEWLKRLNIPIYIIQNANDPLGSFADVKAAFETAGQHVRFIELPGDTHDYLDFERIATTAVQA